MPFAATACICVFKTPLHQVAHGGLHFAAFSK